MSTGSQIEDAPRRVPRQERGEKRVAGLLEAAAAIFAEVGYEAATMRDIAERADSSIGSLYQFFPNKEVVAQTLKDRYCQEMRALWGDLVTPAVNTPTQRLVNQLLDVTLRLIRERPAIIALMETPTGIRPAENIKESLRQQLVELFLTRKPRLSPARARLHAEVTMRIVRELLWIHVEAKPSEREPLIAEMKALLLAYLSPRLS